MTFNAFKLNFSQNNLCLAGSSFYRSVVISPSINWSGIGIYASQQHIQTMLTITYSHTRELIKSFKQNKGGNSRINGEYFYQLGNIIANYKQLSD